MLKVTVDRGRWFRGKGSAESRLLREEDGTMCCLGFACRAAGLSAYDIEGRATPTNVRSPVLPGLIDRKRDPGHDVALDFNWMKYDGSVMERLYETMMILNDWSDADLDGIGLETFRFIAAIDLDYVPGETLLTQDVRERLLTKVGLLVGIEFTFTDGASSGG